jgi:hypothetical protein
MIDAKVMPIIKQALYEYQHNPTMSVHEAIVCKMNIATALKKIYENVCFAKDVPVQPSYINAVFKTFLRNHSLYGAFKEFL